MVADDSVWRKHAEEIFSWDKEMTINSWFGFAWNREVPFPLHHNEGNQLNLGAGYREVSWATSIDFEHGHDLEDQSWWDYHTKIETVDVIWAHGVFEHIEDVPRLLRNCERVLRLGGLLNVVVPHGLSDLHAEDIDHKHPIVEDTWRNIMENPYYSAGGKEPWKLKVHTQFIMGVVWRNLALFTQFQKEA